MDGVEVIVVDAILQEELPVGADIEFAGSLHHSPAAEDFRGIDGQVHELARLAEIVYQRWRVLGEIDEMEAAIAVDVRRRHQMALDVAEALRIALRVVNADQLADIVVDPAMIKADE